MTAQTSQHIALTFGPAGMALYLNGVLQSSDAQVTHGLGTSSGGSGNEEPIVLGANAWASGNLVSTPVQNYFSGTISDFQFFDTQLSENEVATIESGSLINIGPVANDDVGNTNHNTAITFTAVELLDNDTDIDGDVLTISGVNNAVNGIVELNTDGTITFTPTAGYSGDATFDYTR